MKNNNCFEQVWTILSMYETARNYDNILFEKYLYHYSDNLKMFWNISYIKLQDIKKIPNLSFIVRMRCIRQNNKKMYLPTDEKIRLKRLKYSIAKKKWEKTTFFQKILSIIK